MSVRISGWSKSRNLLFVYQSYSTAACSSLFVFCFLSSLLQQHAIFGIVADGLVGFSSSVICFLLLCLLGSVAFLACCGDFP